MPNVNALGMPLLAAKCVRGKGSSSAVLCTSAEALRVGGALENAASGHEMCQRPASPAICVTSKRWYEEAARGRKSATLKRDASDATFLFPTTRSASW